MSLHPALLFLLGLIVITVGAEFVLRSASRIAALLGVRPILIGLTVVSIGTSLPELAVGMTAVSEGKGALAVGNIAGTNIMNILFILGLSAAIRPLQLHLQSIKLDVPVMIGSSLLLVVMVLNGVLSRWEGIVLVLASIVYLLVLVRTSMRESAAVKKEFAEEFSEEVLVEKGTNKGLIWVSNALLLILGMAMTIGGADWLVTGASAIARSFGVSDAIIGLTIVAIGTSAPELVTTIVATIKDDRDVAVGNLIGSSIVNVLVILGLTCVFSNGIAISNEMIGIDIPLAALVAIVCYPVFRSGRKVSRAEGIFFVLCYLIYLSYLLFFRV
ncbi:MAG TPA: calcium/sodium antiporter [Flavisolibacter sp.]|jgi:cation:H+ antiporter|nr:calcium/sodium antiporter [Flavisolibacter sp.]